ncbi:MAG: FliM/FliN family flagellar motor switch protein [Pseudomonadota bacterium]
MSESDAPPSHEDAASAEAPEASAADTGEVLSEDEKDALLEGMSAGVIGDSATPDKARSVKPYEIRPDAYINYGSYPRLQAICQQMAKRVAAQWSALLRCPASVSAEETFTASYATAIAKTRAPVITTMLKLSPLPEHAIVIVDNALLAGLVEAFFGFVADDESAAGAEVATIRQQFTPGELRVSELALTAFFASIAPSWEKLLRVEPEVIGREFDPGIGVGVEPKDRVIVCSFLVQTGTHAGYLRLLLPFTQVADIADDLEGATNARNHTGDPHWRHCIETHLKPTSVKAGVLVGEMHLPLRRIVAMKAGDLLPLTKPEHATLELAGTPRAHGQFGTHDGNNAFRLSAWLPAASDGEHGLDSTPARQHS